MLEELKLKIQYGIHTNEQIKEVDDFMDVFRQLKISTIIDYPNPFFQVGGIYEYTIRQVSSFPFNGAVIFELGVVCKADMSLFIKMNRHSRVNPIIKMKDGFILRRHFETEVYDWPLSRFILDLKSKI